MLKLRSRSLLAWNRTKNELLHTVLKQHSQNLNKIFEKYLWKISVINPIWTGGRGGGGGPPPPPPLLVFFFKYLKSEKRYDFTFLWLLVITYFKRFCQISRNMIFFIWNHILLLVFENKYIRIGNFVGFFFMRKYGTYFK